MEYIVLIFVIVMLIFFSLLIIMIMLNLFKNYLSRKEFIDWLKIKMNCKNTKNEKNKR